MEKPKSRDRAKGGVENYISEEGAVIASELGRYMEHSMSLHYSTTKNLRGELISEGKIVRFPSGDKSNPIVKKLWQLSREDPELKGLDPGLLRIFYHNSITQEGLLSDTELLEKIKAVLHLNKKTYEMGKGLESLVYEFFLERDSEAEVRYSPDPIIDANLHDIDIYIPREEILIKKKPLDHDINNWPIEKKLPSPINIECKNQVDSVENCDYRNFVLRANLIDSKSLISITTTTNLSEVKGPLIETAKGMDIDGVISLTPFPSIL